MYFCVCHIDTSPVIYPDWPVKLWFIIRHCTFGGCGGGDMV